MNAEEIVRQYRQIAPESVSDAKIIETFRRLEGDDDLVQAEIASWWKDESGLEDGSSPPKEKKKKEKKNKKKRPEKLQRRYSFRGNTSQVRLLADPCFTLSDEAVQSLVRYRIPSQSRK